MVSRSNKRTMFRYLASCLSYRQYLGDESQDKKKKPYDTSDWTLHSMTVSLWQRLPKILNLEIFIREEIPGLTPRARYSRRRSTQHLYPNNYSEYRAKQFFFKLRFFFFKFPNIFKVQNCCPGVLKIVLWWYAIVCMQDIPPPKKKISIFPKFNFFFPGESRVMGVK